MEDDMGGFFGYPSNIARESNEDLNAVLELFACRGGPLPPPQRWTSYPFPSSLYVQLQPRVQLLPSDAMEWQLVAPGLSLTTNLMATVADGPGEGIVEVPLPQPEDPLDLDAAEEAANMDLLLQDPDPYQPVFVDPPQWYPVPDADLAPLQPPTPRIQAPVPPVPLPADDPPLPVNTAEPAAASTRGGRTRSSRPRKSRKLFFFFGNVSTGADHVTSVVACCRRRRNRDRTVTRVRDGAVSPDNWAWRKYGQKVIKGSKNLRSYDKCSTDKNCKARKYVECCSDDPMYLEVTYFETHCHSMPFVINNVVPNSAPAAAPPTLPSAMASLSLTATPPPPSSPKIVPESPPQAPALTAFAPGRLSPFLSFSEVGGTSKPPSAPEIAPSTELDVEDYRDASPSRCTSKKRT
ncbi:hypothetical protein HU200_052543 [Digitaria exilis]|uniref:WRKY domain-containing protein n=1 Tax=Digitaria exilis TaxID=1010633 RepID=A0A835AL53_9POAL|nr:hypothetical protein HU200_052543 [Digitaria exilis]